MIDMCKSIFQEEFKIYIAMRKAELSDDAYRHCRHIIITFDEYLYRIDLKEKKLIKALQMIGLKKSAGEYL